MSLNAYKIKSAEFSLGLLDSLMYLQLTATPFTRKRKVPKNEYVEELPHEELPPEEQRQKLFAVLNPPKFDIYLM